MNLQVFSADPEGENVTDQRGNSDGKPEKGKKNRLEPGRRK